MCPPERALSWGDAIARIAVPYGPDCDAPHGSCVQRVMCSQTLFIPFERTVAWA